MKCPKCDYIGFDSGNRCRNCGYDFSLVPPPAGGAADLDLHPSEPAGPLGDFDLGTARRTPSADPTPAPVARGPRRRSEPAPQADGPAAVPGDDLPLFGGLGSDDTPLVRPSAPSAPLSVRRSTPAPARSRPPVIPRHVERPPEVTLPLDLVAPPGADRTQPSPLDAAGAVSLGVRLAASALDWLLLLALDLAVVYFTLRVSRLSAGELATLPLVPLSAFLVLLDGGYLALFTAGGGQTIGKMAFHLKVVTSSGTAPRPGQAVVRALFALLGTLAAGLGLVPALFDPEERTLHDRLAGTRVVRSTAS
jgi:uncharacterized RDD family membrane protein YckC